VNRTRDLLKGLNSEQRVAVAHVRGPLRIVAGAGTGKTRTLTHRFAHLVEQGIPPDRILALTFSRRAAGEFRTKTLDLLDASYARLWISTFHGFCLRVMREERGVFGNPRVMGEAEQRRVIARAVRYDPHAEARTYYVGPTGEQRLVADALTLISRTKDESISLTGFVEYADQRGMERLRELANTYLVYAGLCERENRLDFGDLGALLVDMFERDPVLLQRWRVRFDHVMVDEFQDTNEAQWRLLTLLAPPPHANLTVVGDGCQAIYAFRGASSRFFNRFENEYSGAENVTLTTNYRSRQHILDAAFALITCNRGHESHQLQCESRDAGESVRIAGFADEDAEADYVARRILKLMTHEGLRPEQCAVLCRSVKQSARPLARAFAAYGVPFSMRGYDPEMEDAVQDLCAVLRCVAGSAVWTDAARVLVRREVAFSQMIQGLPEEPLAERVGELLVHDQAAGCAMRCSWR